MQRVKNKLSESLIKGHKLSSVNAWLTLRSVESAAACCTRLHLTGDFFSRPPDRWRTAAAQKYKQTNKQAKKKKPKKEEGRWGEGRGARESVGVEASNKLGRSVVVPCTFKL